MATKTNLDKSKFSILPSNKGYIVYYDGEFFETADSYKEAIEDINMECS